MVEVVEEKPEVARGGVSISVKHGLTDELKIELRPNVQAIEIIEIVAKKRGWAVTELILIREGQDLPIPPDCVIDERYPHDRRHHVHHKSEVKVTVYYQDDDKHHEFKRREPLEDVLTWALKKFEIDPAAAVEFVLTRHGEKDELPLAEHVGHAAGKHHELALDLVRAVIPNGNAP